MMKLSRDFGSYFNFFKLYFTRVRSLRSLIRIERVFLRVVFAGIGGWVQPPPLPLLPWQSRPNQQNVNRVNLHFISMVETIT